MQYISITNIGEFPEDFLFAKIDVERKLIETGIIEERLKLDQFIVRLNIQNYIFTLNNKSISFSIQEGLNDNYVFYSFLDNSDDNLFKVFKERLTKLNYNLSSLTRINNDEIMNMDIEQQEIFIINQQFFKI